MIQLRLIKESKHINQIVYKCNINIKGVWLFLKNKTTDS